MASRRYIPPSFPALEECEGCAKRREQAVAMLKDFRGWLLGGAKGPKPVSLPNTRPVKNVGEIVDK